MKAITILILQITKEIMIFAKKYTLWVKVFIITIGKLKIISQGGINNGKDVIDRIKKGATMVQFYDQLILKV